MSVYHCPWQCLRISAKVNLRRGLGLLGSVTAAVLATVVGSISTFAQGPPQYLVTPIVNNLGESFRPSDINETGIVVGSESWVFFLDTNGTGSSLDLNSLSALWIDLDTGQTTSQLDISKASGVNEQNQIVGDAEGRIFVLNNPLGTSPQFLLLPLHNSNNEPITTQPYRGLAINDLGVVATQGETDVIVFDPRADYVPVSIPVTTEVQEINNDGVIVTRNTFEGGYVISPGGNNPDGSWHYGATDWEYFAGDEFYGISGNISGPDEAPKYRISGLRNPVTSGNPANRRDGGAFRFDYPGSPTRDDLLIIDNAGADAYFCDVNEFGDVAFMFNGRAYVYLEQFASTFELDQLVEFASPEDETSWWAQSRSQPNGINDRGQIIIRGWDQHFLLTPIGPAPGITATPDSELVTSESGDSDTFTVQLNTSPGGTVTVAVTSLDPGEGITDVSSLEFDDLNWDVPQQVTVTGVQDSDADGDQPYFVELAVTAAPVGSDYESMPPVLVGVTNVDDEVSPATLSVGGSTIVEGDNNTNTPGQFAVMLSGTPSGTVEVSYQVSNGSAKKNRDYRMIDPSSGQLVFTPGGPTIQTVAFEIIGDNATELDEDFIITLSNASGATINTAIGTVTILDDD